MSEAPTYGGIPCDPKPPSDGLFTLDDGHDLTEDEKRSVMEWYAKHKNDQHMTVINPSCGSNRNSPA